MSYPSPPNGVRSLEQRIRNVVSGQEDVNRYRMSLALVVVSQMLPDGAIKGGSAMALRYGRTSRFTRDLDAARSSSLEDFREAFAQRLRAGWQGFTGVLVPLAPPRPARIPSEYVMQPFDIKLRYRGTSWCTVRFELGHNEIGDADTPESRLASELTHMFTDLGLAAPQAVPVMSVNHQIAQKLHALSSPGSDRARDLVDLQLLMDREEIDLALIATTCRRLFEYRAQQSWPPRIGIGEEWDSLYVAAAHNLPVLPDVIGAVEWVNNLIMCIDREAEASR